MPFQKVLKDKAYFRRYQVKYRRRRNGKTDYKRRRTLVAQDKNKYNAPKFRFVVRITNKAVICQFVQAFLKGDNTLASANSKELIGYGLPVGLTNYAATYCTGLLCARRLLTKFNLADKYEGQTEVSGEMYEVEPVEDGPNPFYAFLDVGLRCTSTGARVFAALKGAIDGGVEIPSGDRRYVGYDEATKQLDADTLRSYLFAGHVSNYMRTLKDEKPEQYEKQFARFIKNKIDADSLEEVISKTHAAIRANPMPKAKKEKSKEEIAKLPTWPKVKRTRLTYSQRQNSIRQKIEARMRAANA